MQLCDVNIFIYAHRADAPGHAFYRAWLERQLESQKTFLYSEIVLSAFVRIVTHPKIFRPPSPLTTALQFARDVRSALGGVGVMPGARHWHIFDELSRTVGSTGNLVPDTYGHPQK